MLTRRIPDRLVVSALLVTSMPAVVSAQTLTGVVVDATSRRPVPGAEVRLLDGENAVAQALSTAEGGFALSGMAPGAYVLTVERFGYQPHRSDTLRLGEDEVRRLTVEFAPEALPLEELRVTARVRRMRHEPTYAGFYARHADSPPMGSNRVLLRTDPEFEVATSVLDLLENFPRARCAPYVFWNGFYVGRATPRDSYARSLLDVSVRDIEGIEHYRDFASLPMSYRGDLFAAPYRSGGQVTARNVRRCGVIAIWPRRS
jgi:hypothetical protein